MSRELVLFNNTFPFIKKGVYFPKIHFFSLCHEIYNLITLKNNNYRVHFNDIVCLLSSMANEL